MSNGDQKQQQEPGSETSGLSRLLYARSKYLDEIYETLRDEIKDEIPDDSTATLLIPALLNLVKQAAGEGFDSAIKFAEKEGFSFGRER